MYIKKNIYLFTILASSALLFSKCSQVSLVDLPDLYQPASEVVIVDNTTTTDNGYKSPESRTGWKLIWSDEFSAPKIDTSKWSHEVNGDGGGNNEQQYYTDSRNNSYINNNKYLVIKAIKQNYKGKFYTSARMRTKNKADWTYGRFDIRAKVPVQRGTWPAIWMLPTDYVYGSWPQSGEIDIMESIGHQPKTVYGTIHFGEPWPKNKHVGDTTELSQGDLSTAFHVFSVEWEPNEIRWYVDDVLYSTKKPGDLDGKHWPFDQNFHMILNLAVGGDWPGPPDENTLFPKYMYVDYVRVFKKL
ncbi:MAG: family 16 glycosylhydrolase [Flavobacteriales bacterium]